MSDDVIRPGDWVQTPEAKNVFLDRRLAKVVAVDDGVAMVQITGLTELHPMPAHQLRKITWATPYEPPVRTVADKGDAGPFCTCGEPVNRIGQACRTCRRQEFLAEWNARDLAYFP